MQDHLSCFFPGVLALGVLTGAAEQPEEAGFTHVDSQGPPDRTDPLRKVSFSYRCKSPSRGVCPMRAPLGLQPLSPGVQSLHDLPSTGFLSHGSSGFSRRGSKFRVRFRVQGVSQDIHAVSDWIDSHHEKIEGWKPESHHTLLINFFGAQSRLGERLPRALSLNL